MTPVTFATSPTSQNSAASITSSPVPADRLTSGGDSEGLISNYQRVIDGFIAGLDRDTLRNAQNVANSGFQETILDIGF